MLFLLIIFTTLPYLYLFTQMDVLGGITHAPGNIVALIAVQLMWWQPILGMRFIMANLDPDYIKHLSLHKKIGKYGMLLVFLHPAWQVYNYAQTYFWVLNINFSSIFETYVTLGRLAYLLFITIFFTSAILRSRLRFRPWLYIHYLAYPMMLLIFIHATQIGTYLNSYPWLRLYWLFFTYSYFAILIFRLLNYLNLFRYKYTLVSKQKLTSKITLYNLKPLNKPITPNVGQFIYLRPSFLAEAHPFTAMKYNRKDKSISLAIKSVGPFTKKLTSLKKNSKVYLDGPYGVFTKEGHNNNPKVIIAGGIGITPFVNLINNYANKKTYLFYANRKLKNAIFRKKFINKLNSNYFDALSKQDVKNKQIINHRLNKTDLQNNLPGNYFRKANFYICGSPNFMNSIINDLKSLGVPKDHIFSEEFSL